MGYYEHINCDKNKTVQHVRNNNIDLKQIINVNLILETEMAACEISAREAEKRRCRERIRHALKISKSSGSDDREYARETMEILREADSTQALILRGNSNMKQNVLRWTIYS